MSGSLYKRDVLMSFQVEKKFHPVRLVGVFPRSLLLKSRNMFTRYSMEAV